MLSDQLFLALFLVTILVLYGTEIYLRSHLRWYWGIIGMFVFAIVAYWIDKMPASSGSSSRPRTVKYRSQNVQPAESEYSYEY